MPFLITFWREIILALMGVAMFIMWGMFTDTIEDRDNTIATLTAESKIGEIQQDALRKAITDQSEAITKQRIDAEQRAKRYKADSKAIRAKYDAERSHIVTISGDEECEAMRQIIRETVNE